MRQQLKQRVTLLTKKRTQLEESICTISMLNGGFTITDLLVTNCTDLELEVLIADMFTYWMLHSTVSEEFSHMILPDVIHLPHTFYLINNPFAPMWWAWGYDSPCRMHI